MTGIGETVNLFPVNLKHRDSRETKLPFYRGTKRVLLPFDVIDFPIDVT